MATPVETALETVRSLVQADGYDAQLDGYSPGELKVRIVAGPDACADCLVPKSLMASIIAASLPAELAGSTVTLTYPADADADTTP